MAGHERDTGPPDGGKNGTAFGNGRRHRLLYHDVLARFGAGDGDIGVQMVRQRNHHGFDIGIGQEFTIIEIALAAESSCESRKALRIVAAGRSQPCIRDRLERLCMGRAKMARADDTDAKHVRLLRERSSDR